ncbi:MAG TPA: NifB/NifX family molybdenum-iron cluster-binding protein [Candidatus Limiplasma sp.]|nr:NifB/NifX family molybdenum-iron cluster-binding protein [Candidatus Limiplasma sp.]
MKIAVSATGNSMDSQMDQRFGRAASFIIVQTETMEFEALDNNASASAGGAGISAAQMIADKDVKAVITGNVGPNAMNVLKAASIEIYKGLNATVKENVEQYNKGTLEKIQTTVPSHFGMGLKS